MTERTPFEELLLALATDPAVPPKIRVKAVDILSYLQKRDIERHRQQIKQTHGT